MRAVVTHDTKFKIKIYQFYSYSITITTKSLLWTKLKNIKNIFSTNFRAWLILKPKINLIIKHKRWYINRSMKSSGKVNVGLPAVTITLKHF